MNRLVEIIAHKRTEIEPLLRHTQGWREQASKVSSFRGFKKSLNTTPFGLIAEIKKA